jgi:hypothetical protein
MMNDADIAYNRGICLSEMGRLDGQTIQEKTTVSSSFFVTAIG